MVFLFPTDSVFPLEFENVLQCLRQYSEQLPNICSRTLGIQLDVPSVTLYAIERKYSYSTETSKEKVIQHWISSPSIQPSWCSLVDALNSMDYRNAAHGIAEQHSKQHISRIVPYCMLFSSVYLLSQFWLVPPLNTFPPSPWLVMLHNAQVFFSHAAY